MYHGGGPTRWVRQLPDLSGGPIDPHVLARQALTRLRTLLAGYLPGMGCPIARLRGWLRTFLPVPALEAERFFALGWLAWLEGDFPAARALFERAVVRA